MILNILCVCVRIDCSLTTLTGLFLFNVSGNQNAIDSVLYKWDSSKRQFESIQLIPTVAAYDWTHFEVDGYHFLVVANAFDGITTRVDSVIYFYQNGQFVQFQTIEVSALIIVCSYMQICKYWPRIFQGNITLSDPGTALIKCMWRVCNETYPSFKITTYTYFII